MNAIDLRMTRDYFLVPRVNYAGTCSSDTDCIPTLICPTAPGMCSCPTPLPDLVCNCANGTYYDSTLLQCGKSTKKFTIQSL